MDDADRAMAEKRWWNRKFKNPRWYAWLDATLQKRVGDFIEKYPFLVIFLVSVLLYFLVYFFLTIVV